MLSPTPCLRATRCHKRHNVASVTLRETPIHEGPYYVPHAIAPTMEEFADRFSPDDGSVENEPPTIGEFDDRFRPEEGNVEKDEPPNDAPENWGLLIRGDAPRWCEFAWGNAKPPPSPPESPAPAPLCEGADDMNEPPMDPAAPDMYVGMGACIGLRLCDGGKPIWLVHVRHGFQQVHRATVLLLLALCRHLPVSSLDSVFLHRQRSVHLERDEGK